MGLIVTHDGLSITLGNFVIGSGYQIARMGTGRRVGDFDGNGRGSVLASMAVVIRAMASHLLAGESMSLTLRA